MTFKKSALRITCAATMLAVPAGIASAGGYTAPVEPIVVAPAAEVASPLAWQGGYVGATIGMAGLGDDRVGIAQFDGPVLARAGELEAGGLNYGLRAGYRIQRVVRNRNIVFGAELGLEGGDIGDEISEAGYDSNFEVDKVLALRFKTGILNPAQDTMFYGIAGVARGDFNMSINGTGAAGAVALDESFSNNGYIVGLGVERKLNANWSVTGEWEYANFGKTHLEDATGKSTEATPDYHNIKLGVNYSF